MTTSIAFWCWAGVGVALLLWGVFQLVCFVATATVNAVARVYGDREYLDPKEL